jgi:hypothetical protein
MAFAIGRSLRAIHQVIWFQRSSLRRTREPYLAATAIRRSGPAMHTVRIGRQSEFEQARQRRRAANWNIVGPAEFEM